MADTKPLVGFIGQGFIGKNYADDFERRGYTTVRYALEEPYVANRDKIKDCDFVLIAVPTPTTPSGFDYSIVRSAISLVGKGKVAVIKSTIVPGTTKELQAEFPDRIVFYSPEFLSEATAAHDASYPFMNIVGLTEDSPRQKTVAEKLHTILPDAPFSQTCSSTEAEIIKYSHNGSGYTQIMFFNLMFDLANYHGCNWNMIRRAIEADPLVNNRYARPIHKSGRGAGGHCFIKDVAALRAEYSEKIGNEAGVALFEAMERKNIELLKGTGKDLDLLEGVYGEGVLSVPTAKIDMPTLSAVRGDVRVLICTEALDRSDPILGYFHGWVKEFARHAYRVHVLCLGYGDRALPPNVMEHTLGKESMRRGNRFFKRFVYSGRFMRHAWRLRREYDLVLVHLSSEFAVVGGLFWKILGKRIGFWHNDAEASLFARMAIGFSNVVFYSNPNSFAVRYPHSRYVPMGIEADMYTLERRAAKESLLFLGRISPKKNLGAIIGAFASVRENVQNLSLDIYGEPRHGDAEYAAKLRSQYAQHERSGALSYKGSILHDLTPAAYASHEIFVHAGSVHGSKKTLYEAMAAGCLVITSEREVQDVIDPRLFLEEPTEENIAKAIRAALSLSEEKREHARSVARAYVRREHALSSVVPTVLEMLGHEGGELARLRS